MVAGAGRQEEERRGEGGGGSEGTGGTRTPARYVINFRGPDAACYGRAHLTTISA